MKEMFFRGLMTGLIGGIGADLFWFFLDMNVETSAGWLAAGILAGLVGGAALGLLMMALLAFLRYLDRRKGWSLASRLEASEPGVLGFLLGLIATFPGAGLGGYGCGYACYLLLKAMYHTLPDQYAFVTCFFFGLFMFPPAVLAGLSAGALAGATIGTSAVGFLRGLFHKPGPEGAQAEEV